MPGLSASARRVRAINANWTAAATDGGDGIFEFLIVTEDGERHVVQTTPIATATLTALINTPGVVLIWDSSAGGLTIGNVFGDWLSPELSLIP